MSEHSSLEILRELIKIDSQSNVSNKRIVEFISKRLENLDISLFNYKKEDLELHNLIVKIKGDSDKNPLVFVGHTDSVRHGDLKNWDTDPFSPTEKEGKLYGLGSSDMKSGLACMVSAALELKSKPKNDVYLIFDADEEENGTGGKKVVKDFSLRDARVIVAEPTDRKIKLGHRGCLDLEIKIPGKEKHSAYSDFDYNERENAIIKSVTVINSLREYSKEIEKRKDPILEKPNLTIGQINGGKGANSVAGSCSIKISRRIISSESLAEAYKEITDLVKKVCPDASVSIIFDGVSFATDKNSSFVKLTASLAKQYLGSDNYDIHKGWTEAALFAKYGEVLIFGPGETDMCHKPNEYVQISDLDKFTNIYLDLMEG